MPPHDPKPDLHLEDGEAAAAAVATAAITTASPAAAAAAAAVEVPQPSATTPACKPTACTCCGDEFPTRSALFRHLQNPPEHCSATRQDAGEKVLLLLGYDCSVRDASETASSAGALQGASAAARKAVAGGDSAAGLVLQALGVGRAEEDALSRPAGFSQGSSVGSRSCPLLVQEPGVSATADTVCLRAPTTVSLAGTHAWLDKTNALLDGTGVRLLGRMQVALPTFHAEIHASRRRYEYLLPAWLLDEAAEGPWAGPARGQESLIPLLKQLRGRALRPFGHCNGSGSGKRRRCPLWHNFSDTAVPHSPSAARRLYRFYASEIVELRGADYLCMSVSGDAFVSQQVRGMVGLAVAAARGLISGADIAACIDPSRREDLLPLPLAPTAPCSLAEIGYPSWQAKLGGYCMSPGAEEREAPPLEGWSDDAARSNAASFRLRVLDKAAGWWEDRRRGVDWFRDVLQPGALKLRREIDAANERKLSVGTASGEPEPLPADAVLALKEAPAAFANVLRWLKEADASGRWPISTPARSLVISDGKEENASSGGKSKSKSANGRSRAGGGGGRGRCRGKGRGKGREKRAAEAATEEKREEVGAREEPPQQEQEEQQQQQEGQQQKEGGEKRQLQEQQQQEQQQPPRQQQQQQQQEEDKEEEEEGEQQQKKKQQQQQQQQRGGSFTVGAFPPPCPPPRGNRLFPELTRAAFELEAILLPDRPPSTTIAVNRHARFRPHVDSGAGAGQSRSLIVGLGDYVGGELVVEGEVEDIRYRPLEFDGWTQRHWTRPFKGERYSLVWFTPKGCEGVAGDARFSVPVEDAEEI